MFVRVHRSLCVLLLNQHHTVCVRTDDGGRQRRSLISFLFFSLISWLEISAQIFKVRAQQQQRQWRRFFFFLIRMAGDVKRIFFWFTCVATTSSSSSSSSYRAGFKKDKEYIGGVSHRPMENTTAGDLRAVGPGFLNTQRRTRLDNC